MIIDCITDLHGFYPTLEGGDLLIVAGDLTSRDEVIDWCKFFHWLECQEYTKKIFIGGNHDNFLLDKIPSKSPIEFGLPWSYKRDFEYICDSGTEFEGLKIWGSPWTKTFKGMNPRCKAFTCETEEQLAEKWAMIPGDIDILITHGPPKGILDWNKDGLQCGSISLFERSRKLKNLKLFCFGHIHEAYSVINTQEMTNSLPMLLSSNKPNCLPIIVNCSHVNERYEPVNNPVRIVL